METAAPEITFDDFLKVDMRVGTIVSAERVPKSSKLLKLQVNFGPSIGVRQIIAGIGLGVESAMFLNVNVVAVINLAPKKIMGLESHGMILAGHLERDEGVSVVNCKDSPNGTRIG